MIPIRQEGNAKERDERGADPGTIYPPLGRISAEATLGMAYFPGGPTHTCKKKKTNAAQGGEVGLVVRNVR